jgi:hypothetical protein
VPCGASTLPSCAFLAPHPTGNQAAGSTQLGSPVRKRLTEKALYNKVRKLQSDTSEQARGKT